MKTISPPQTKPEDRLKSENRDPISGAPGSHPVGVGVGAAAAGATGAALGLAAGPAGAVIGGTVGALAGGLIGKGVAEAVDPTSEEAYWRDRYQDEAYYDQSLAYDDYAPAYRTGYAGFQNYGRAGRDFDSVQAELENDYNASRGTSRLEWEKARDASRAAWNRASRQDTYEPASNMPPPVL